MARTHAERKEWLNTILVEIRAEMVAYEEDPAHSRSAAVELRHAADCLNMSLLLMENWEKRQEAWRNP